MKTLIAPILLITFNRPTYVKQLISALRKSKVNKIYVFKDGPRPNNIDDMKASQEIEDLISSIDWNCQVITNYMTNNLGCGYGPFSAISWAFQFEDRLIILEDDCIPSEPFFPFASDLLERYKDNEKVRLISGRSQLSSHPIFETNDYIFTQYAPTWGWATWKRVWVNFDMQMRELKSFFDNGGFENQFSSTQEARFFNKRYQKDLKNLSLVFHVWDHQFGYHGRFNGALGITPSKNLITYIGIEGTHPVEQGSEINSLESCNEFNYNYNDNITIDKSYDYLYFKKFVNNPNIFSRIINKLNRLIYK